MTIKRYATPQITEIPMAEINDPRPLAAAQRAGLRLNPIWAAEPGAATEANFAALAAACPAEAEALYAVGGGLAVDAAKYVAYRRALPLLAIPTALSVDAHLTWASGVRRAGCVAYLETTAPQMLYVDYALIAGAPPAVRAAGICDLLSIATGLWDWQFAESRGMNPPEQRLLPWVVTQAQAILAGAIDIAAAAGQGDQAGLRALLALLALEVQLCNLIGHSRPEEGSEHYLAYALEAHPAIGSGHAHGDLVGPAILRVAERQGQPIAALRAALEAAQTPLDRTPQAVLREVEASLPAYALRHRLAFGIAHVYDQTL